MIQDQISKPLYKHWTQISILASSLPETSHKPFYFSPRRQWWPTVAMQTTLAVVNSLIVTHKANLQNLGMF